MIEYRTNPALQKPPRSIHRDTITFLMKDLINIAFQNFKKGLILSSLAIILLISNHTFAQVNESGVFIDSNRGQQDERVDFNLTGNQVESIITNWGSVGNGNGSINQAGVWPRGTGHGHIHEMTGIVSPEPKIPKVIM